MTKKLVKFILALTAGTLIGAMAAGSLHAQQAGIKRTILMKNELTVEGREWVMAHAEIPVGMAAGRHFHHGEEMGYVLEGEMVLEIAGKAAQTLKAGDVYFIEAGKAHDAKAIGNVPLKLLAVYLPEKGKPFAVPVQ